MTNKLLLFTTTAFFITCGGAHASVANIESSPMSKNPNCWDKGGDEKSSFKCPTKFQCSQISSVIRNENESYTCAGVEFETFDCTQLIEEQGLDIVGFSVLITQQYVDGCHKPGACGIKACMPQSTGFATLNALCE